ncbi:unnamed protein product [Ixodes hexagonus]
MTSLVVTMFLLNLVHAQSPRQDGTRGPQASPGTQRRRPNFAQVIGLQAYPQRKQQQMPQARKQQQQSFDLQTVTEIVLIAATLSALAVGVACYACRDKSPIHRGRRQRHARYDRLEGTSTPDAKTVLRLSPVGPACSLNRNNWASISLVNLLNSYPTSTSKMAIQDGDLGARFGSTSDTT